MIRNIAIIAHVDHGKTTLVDALLKASHTFRDNEVLDDRMMDSNQLEKERGITILSKNTAIKYKDYKINILDTPGHADFGGEVERIMKMVDGVLLIVDAYEGTMPQTRFVLKEAFKSKLKPIVVINKIDKPTARPKEVLDEVLELFIDLECDEADLDFKVCYTSAINGTCSLDSNPNSQVKGMDALFDLIIDEIPAPNMDKDIDLLFQPCLLDYNDFVGRIGIGKIRQGTIYANKEYSCLRLDDSIKKFRLQKLYTFSGLNKVEVESATAGDIVAISGLADIYVGESVCEVGKEVKLEPILISEPTVQITIGTNTSPFCGKDGKLVTASKIEERLFKEKEKDVSLKVERVSNAEEWILSGRGELHLGILIENMRREGFEFQISRPEVILKEENGVVLEPFEDVYIDAPSDYVGSIIEILGNRKGIMISMDNVGNNTKIHYHIPSRALIGFHTDFMSLTKGLGILNHSFLDYREKENVLVGERVNGVLVASDKGSATAYAIGGLEDRGSMFVSPGDEIYEGMIVGVCNKDLDLAVNVVKQKNLTNTRSATKDNTVVLKAPLKMNLEASMEFINSDELLEITPKHIRLRKKILNTEERKKFDSLKKRNR